MVKYMNSHPYEKAASTLAGGFLVLLKCGNNLKRSRQGYPRTSAPVAPQTFFTSFAWALSTSSLVSVRSAARYVSA